MWAGVVFVLLAMPARRGAGFSAYQYYEAGRQTDSDFYDNYNDDVHRLTTRTTSAGVFTRIKRFGEEIPARHPTEMADMKEALDKVLYGNKLGSMLTRKSQKDYTDIYEYAEKTGETGQNAKNESTNQHRDNAQKWSPSELDQVPSSIPVQHWTPSIEVEKWSVLGDSRRTLETSSSPYVIEDVKADLQKLISRTDATTPSPEEKWSFDLRQPTITEQTWMPSFEITQESTTEETRTYKNEEVKEDIKKLLRPGAFPQEWTSTIAVQHWSPSATGTFQHSGTHEEYNDETLSITTSEDEATTKDQTDRYYKKYHLRNTDRYGNPLNKSASIATGPPGNQTRETVNYGTITVITLRPDAYRPESDYEQTEGAWSLVTERQQGGRPGAGVIGNTTVQQGLTGSTTGAAGETATTAGDATTAGKETAAPAGNATAAAKETATAGTGDSHTTAAGTGDIDATAASTTTAQETTKTVVTTERSTTAAITTTVTTGVRTRTTTTKTTKSPKKTKSPYVDLNAVIAIIANLTYDYDWNLTEQFNKTLIDHGVPTCPTPSTPTTSTTTPPEYDFANTSVVGKCFVCGLTTPRIPRNAHCADAFAGDFLPLVPVDPRARGKIASFRKYCRHLDVHNYVENPTEPRSIYGRFTGGCGVRWTDLSGVYTQRTCRSKFRPLTGKHFGSKRMAKLELALISVDNGCIISPMATLLPLSRGVSLYARFHACVCTGSWCNRAPRAPCTDTTRRAALLLALLLCYIHYVT